MGAAALLVASGCPPGHSPSHVGLDPVWARAQEAGIPVVFHVGGTGDLIDPSLLPQRTADPARLPRRRGELPLGRLHGHPRSAGADAGHDDLRRRARAVPATCASASSSRARSGCRRGRARWSRPSTRSPATRSGCRRCRCARPSTCGARSASRRTRPRTSAGSSSSPAPRSACSRRTTPTSRAVAARSSGSRPRSADTDADAPRALLHEQLPRPHGLGRGRPGRLIRHGGRRRRLRRAGRLARPGHARRHDGRGRTAGRVPRRLPLAVQHRAAPVCGVDLEAERDLPRRPAGRDVRRARAAGRPARHRGRSSAARPATRSTSSSGADGHEGPDGVPLLDALPDRFVGRRVDLVDVGAATTSAWCSPRCAPIVARPRPGPWLTLEQAEVIPPGHPA